MTRRSREPEWADITAHNVRMLLTSTRAISEKRGPEYIESFEWWPRVKEIAYGDAELPAKVEEAAAPENPPTVKKPRRRRTKKT